jgi:hypothetical protein
MLIKLWLILIYTAFGLVFGEKQKYLLSLFGIIAPIDGIF